MKMNDGSRKRGVATASWPHGTEERCCFVCAHSSTNPAWLDDPDTAWRFMRRAERDWPLKCWRFSGHLVAGYLICGAFEERGGWGDKEMARF
jgi:hypothetical protein